MRVARTLVITAAAVTALSGASCTGPRQPSGGAKNADTSAARAALSRLEADARALVSTNGCNMASRCRAAPIGARVCGGPRTYVAYCAATTDSMALFKKLDQLKTAETQINQQAGMLGTCEFLMPPTVTSQGGSCTIQVP